MLRDRVLAFLGSIWTVIKSVAAIWVTLWLYLWASQFFFQASKAAALPLNIALCASAFVLLTTFMLRRINSEEAMLKGSTAYGLFLVAVAIVIAAAAVAL